jgi:hypothetical protein
LDAFLAPGSELWMFCEVPEAVREKKLSEGDLADHKLKNIVLIHREGNANIRRHLELLPLETFSSVSVEHQQSSSPSSIWFGFAFASSIPILQKWLAIKGNSGSS